MHVYMCTCIGVIPYHQREQAMTWVVGETCVCVCGVIVCGVCAVIIVCVVAIFAMTWVGGETYSYICVLQSVAL